MLFVFSVLIVVLCIRYISLWCICIRFLRIGFVIGVLIWLIGGFIFC